MLYPAELRARAEQTEAISPKNPGEDNGEPVPTASAVTGGVAEIVTDDVARAGLVRLAARWPSLSPELREAVLRVVGIGG